MSDRAGAFSIRGWLHFAAEPQLREWSVSTLPAACHAVNDPANAHWLRCGGTWFVGVDALPNDAQGRVADGPPLAGAALDFIRAELRGGSLPLHRAQLSVCFPGYPEPMPTESENAFRFRREHDAAHVDGLFAEGSPKKRFLREPHAWILGLPLLIGDVGASPTVVWEGSHLLMRAAFEKAFSGHDPATWGSVDLTDIYVQARREVLGTCRRVIVDLQPGEALLLHRHALHGMAPWADGARAPEPGRIIAWFRPQFARLGEWMAAP